jgi:hypothetical protein
MGITVQFNDDLLPIAMKVGNEKTPDRSTSSVADGMLSPEFPTIPSSFSQVFPKMDLSIRSILSELPCKTILLLFIISQNSPA